MECKVGKASADVDGGAQIIIQGSNKRPMRADRG